MRRAIIIEDEQQAQEALQKMLSLVAPELEITGSASNLISAKKLIEENNYNVIFLDIQLRDGTAFDLLDSLIELPESIIFTTAHSEYAIQAFKVHAIDYLLKPINPQELLPAVTKAMKKIQEKDQLKKFLSARYTLHSEEKIILKTNRAQHVIKTSQIIRLQAEGAYTNFITTKESIFVSKNLKHYEERLNPHQFLRIHQSHLINKDRCKQCDLD